MPLRVEPEELAQLQNELRQLQSLVIQILAGTGKSPKLIFGSGEVEWGGVTANSAITTVNFGKKVSKVLGIWVQSRQIKGAAWYAYIGAETTESFTVVGVQPSPFPIPGAGFKDSFYWFALVE